VSIPHLAFPLRIVNGRAVTVEQDTIDHLVDQVAVALSTPPGWREEAPEFGARPALMTAAGIDLETVRGQLAESVPDAAAIVSRIDSVDDLRHDQLRVLISEGGF